MGRISTIVNLFKFSELDSLQHRLLKIGLLITLTIGTILLVVMGSVFILFGLILPPQYEITNRVANDTYEVECELMDRGAIGPYSLDIYLTKPKRPWYDFFGSEDLVEFYEMYVEIDMFLDNNSILTIDTGNRVYLTSLPHFHCSGYFFSRRDEISELEAPFDTISNNFATIKHFQIAHHPASISIQADFYPRKQEHCDKEIVILNARSIEAELFKDSLLIIDIFWSNGEITNDYLINLTKI
jgi:hypothetical protein